MLEMNQGHLPNNNHVSIRGDHFVLDQGVAIDGHNGEVDLAIDEIADQTPVNYTKLMLLNIVDPNLAPHGPGSGCHGGRWFYWGIG